MSKFGQKKAPIYIKISMCRLMDALLLFPEGHACTQNGVSYKNHENNICHVTMAAQFRLQIVIYKIVMWVQGF